MLSKLNSNEWYGVRCVCFQKFTKNLGLESGHVKKCF